MSSKHSAPPVSPARDQAQKKAKSNRPLPLSKHFVRTNEVKDDIMKANHIRFKCINEIYNEMKGEPILLHDKEVAESKIKKLDNELNDIVEKMKDRSLDDSSLITMAKEADEKKKEWETYKESVQNIKVSISYLKEARKNARLALEHNRKVREFSSIADFTILVQRADALLANVDDMEEEQSDNIEDEESAVDLAGNNDEESDSSNAIEEEPEDDDVNVIQQVFPSQKKYNSDRKTIAKMKEAAKQAPPSPSVKLNKYGHLLEGEKLPIHVRYEYRDRRGSGLFKYNDAFDFLRKRIESEDEEKWWAWKSVKLQDNKRSEYGEFTCKACASSMMHLRSITTHLKSSKHKKKVEEKKKRLENDEQNERMKKKLLLLTNCRTFVENELRFSSVLIDTNSGKILDHCAPCNYDDDEVHHNNECGKVDCNGCILSPGFIDIQINGAHGVDFSNPNLSETDVFDVSASLPQYGVTSFCPTIITSSNDVYERNINLISSIICQKSQKTTNNSIGLDSNPKGAKILGIHLEGPYFSKSKRGAHNADFIKEEVSVSSMAEVYSTKNLNDKHVKIITLAPELPGALSTIQHLVHDSSIVVSMGHTSASLDQGIQGVKHGASLITHLFNAMKPFHHRDPGLFGLLQCNKETKANFHDDPYFSIIVDGLHSHPTSVKMAQKLNPDKLILVTDAMSAMGLGGGTHSLGSMSVTIEKGKARITGTETLAGSVVSMDTCVRNLLDFTNCSKVDALKSATEHPARVLRCEHEIGSITKGLDADLVLLDDDLNVLKTWVEGKLVFDRKSRKRKL